MASQDLFNGFNVVGNAVANTVTSNVYYTGTANIFVDNYGNFSNVLSIKSVGNITASNALVTTNLFANTVTLSNATSTIKVTGNIYASNALTTTNLFANTLTLSNATSTISVTGNIYASNALTTTNLFANTLTLSNDLSTITVTGDISSSNAMTTAAIFTSTLAADSTVSATTLYGALAGSNAINGTIITAGIYFSGSGQGLTGTGDSFTAGKAKDLTGNPTISFGNIYSANAVTTTNVFANTLTLSSAASTINVIGTVVATTLYGALAGSNTISGSTITATVGGQFSGSGAGLTGTATGFTAGLAQNLTGNPTISAGNIYSTNALTTTNIFANTLTLSNDASTINVTGNIYASNSFQTKNIFASGNVVIGPTATAIQANLHVERSNVFIGNSAIIASQFSTTGPTYQLIFDNSANPLSNGKPNKITLFSNTTAGIYAGIGVSSVTQNFVNLELLSYGHTNIRNGLGYLTAVFTNSGTLSVGGFNSSSKLYVFGDIFSTTDIKSSNSVQTANVIATGNVVASQFMSAGGFAVVAGGPTLGVTGNVYASNALTTTNIVASGNVTATTFYGALAGTNTISASNIFVSNALTTTNIFANTLTLANASASITGNLYVSNALQTTNLFTNTLTMSNATSTINVIGTVTATNFYGAHAGSNVASFLNVYSANALQTTNLFASSVVVSNTVASYTSTQTINQSVLATYIGGGTISSTKTRTINTYSTSYPNFLATGGSAFYFNDAPVTALTAKAVTNFGSATAMSADGNSVIVTGSGTGLSPYVYVLGSRFRVNNTINVYGGAVGIGTTAPNANLHVTGNIYASNALQTTNVVASGNVSATQFVGAGGFAVVTGGPTVGVTGNIYASNAIQTTNVNFSTATLGTAAAGELLYNTYLYSTLNTTSGRGSVPVQQVYRLTGTPASNASTSAFYFFSSLATTSTTAINLEASSVYDIEMHCYFQKVTAVGTVTWTLVASSAPTLMSGYYTANPTGGVAPGAPTTGYAGALGSATAAFPATGSLSVANHSFFFKIQVITNSQTTFDIQATQSAAGLTPIVGSYYRVTKIATTTGSFA